MKAKARWEVNLNIPENIDVWIDWYNPKIGNNPRFVFLCEPSGRCNYAILCDPSGYSHLFTYFEELLHLPNSHFFTIITPFVDADPDMRKKFSVSTVVSGRLNNTGHTLRHELWKRQDEIKIPKDFYLSGNPTTLYKEADYEKHKVLGSECKDKINVFDNMFHIAIETTNRKHYFSEKLIDCFLTMTIPIYWGIDTIGDYFNKEGIIQCRDVNEIIEACNILTFDDYIKRLDAMKENYLKSLQYTNYENQISQIINNLL